MAATAAVAVGASASPWLRAYQISGARAYLWTAAGASVLLSMATTRVAKLRPAAAYAASVLGLVLVSLALTGPHPGQFWHGLTRGPAMLVSETLPLGGHRASLAAPLVFTWACGAATSELLWRVRSSPVGLGVPVLGFVVAYAITSGAPGDDVVAGS
ncbi:MAG: hypothetical protein J2P57_22285, partial [Acidimicrobiaceae bacterium]|nr:hypothetical protein [Acidimicrobiaceae bacterium]